MNVSAVQAQSVQKHKPSFGMSASGTKTFIAQHGEEVLARINKEVPALDKFNFNLDACNTTIEIAGKEKKFFGGKKVEGTMTSEGKVQFEALKNKLLKLIAPEEK